MTARDAAASQAEIPKSELMARIAVELRALETQLRTIEDAVSAAVRIKSDIPRSARQPLQQLDRSAQTLGCLADCIDAIRTSEPDQPNIAEETALANLRLPSVAERLKYGPKQTTNQTNEPDIW